MKNITIISIYSISLFFFYRTELCAQEKNLTDVKVYGKIGKGITFLASDSSFSMTMRFRTQFRSNAINNETSTVADALIRRLRLSLSGFVITPKLTYAIQFHFAESDFQPQYTSPNDFNRQMIRDASISYEFFPQTSLTFGQTKLPMYRSRIISSGNLQFTDRSLAHSIFDIDRDLGIWIRNQFNLSGDIFLKEIFAFTGGEGRNQSVNSDGYCYTTRVEVLPFGLFKDNGDYFEGDFVREKNPKLALASSYSYNQKAIRTSGQIGYLLSTPVDMRTFVLDGVFKWNGLSMEGEFFNRSVSSVVGFTISKYVFAGQGWHFQTGYFFAEQWESAARIAQVSPDKSVEQFAFKQTDFNFCISRYLVGHSIKAQTEITYSKKHFFNNKPDETPVILRFQFQIGI